jgi:RNA polymerase sigma-70 factor (ECF subfamily)
VQPSNRDDAFALVRRAQSADQDTFAALYQQTVPAVFRYAKSIVRDPTTAEDVTAQTYLQPWKQIASLKKPERFEAWVLRITHNLALNELRRTRPASIDESPEPTDSSRYHDPARALHGKDDAAAVRVAIQELPELQREVLVLRYFAGLSHAAVAVQVGKSENNVRVVQHRALRRLRDLLTQAGYDDATVGAAVGGG